MYSDNEELLKWAYVYTANMYILCVCVCVCNVCPSVYVYMAELRHIIIKAKNSCSQNDAIFEEGEKKEKLQQ